MNIILRAIVLVVGLPILVIMALLIPILVGPFSDLVLSREAVHEMGFASGVKLVMTMGPWVLGLLGLGLLLWFMFSGIVRDVLLRSGAGGRRR